MYLKNSCLVLACLAVAACGEDGGDTVTDPGPYQLSFSVD